MALKPCIVHRKAQIHYTTGCVLNRSKCKDCGEEFIEVIINGHVSRHYPEWQMELKVGEALMEIASVLPDNWYPDKPLKERVAALVKSNLLWHEQFKKAGGEWR